MFQSLQSFSSCWTPHLLCFVLYWFYTYFNAVQLQWLGIALYLCVYAQSRPTLCNLMDCSPPGSSVHGVPQVRMLEWVAISYSRGSSQTRDQPMSPALAGRFFTIEPPGSPHWAITLNKWWLEKSNVQRSLASESSPFISIGIIFWELQVRS